MSVPMSSIADLTPLVTSAGQDLIRGLKNWKVWTHLGWFEIKRRYRRTVIGPFWNTVSLAVFVGSLGSVGAALWNLELMGYLPYVAAGMAVWLLVTAMISEAGSVFISGSNLIYQIRCDYSVLIYALVYRNFIVFLHNLGVYLVISLFYQPHAVMTPTLALVIPGIFLVLANCAWIVLLLSMLCLRFRDLQQLVVSFIQILMFVTPILWMPDTLPAASRTFFVTGNPFYYFIDIVRAPLLGQQPAPSTYATALLVAVAGWSLAYLVFRRFRKNIPYWI
jgi:ABC-type polysaccharide/polyol phosphate export permease